MIGTWFVNTCLIYIPSPVTLMEAMLISHISSIQEPNDRCYNSDTLPSVKTHHESPSQR